MYYKWTNWCEEISAIQTIKFTRHYFGEHSKNAFHDLPLYCFNDARANAYGAVNCASYRVNKQIFTSFIICKVRVADKEIIPT